MHRLRAAAILLLCPQLALSAWQTPTTSLPAESTSVAIPAVRPIGVSAIRGSVLDAAGKPLPERTVRLRDTRTGKILKTIATDPGGSFAFESIDPGNYVVELLNADGTVQAASHLVTVTAGDSVAALIKLPLKVRSLGGLIGHNLPAAALVAGSAAAAGVLAVQVKDCVSPPCSRP